MRRVVQKEIADPLTDEILFGKLSGGGKVLVIAKDTGKGKEIEFKFEN